MKEKVTELRIAKGTTIKFNGLPFELIHETEVSGLESNMKLAKNYKCCCSQDEHSSLSPYQAESRGEDSSTTNSVSLSSKHSSKKSLT